MQGSARIDELRQKFHENPRRYFAPLANEYRKAGDPEQAIAICRAHLAQQPGHMSGHVVYGQALYDAKRIDEARTVFEKALTLDPDNAIVLRQLGDIARQQGDTIEARHWYGRALETDPNDTETAAYVAELTEPVGTSVTDDIVQRESVDAVSEASEIVSDVEVPLPVAVREPETASDEVKPLVTDAPQIGERPEALVDFKSNDLVDIPPADSTDANTAETFPPVADEVPARPAADDVAWRKTPPHEASPFVTRTMAELYAKQGYKSAALDVYRQLALNHPADQDILARIEELSSEPAATDANVQPLASSRTELDARHSDAMDTPSASEAMSSETPPHEMLPEAASGDGATAESSPVETISDQRPDSGIGHGDLQGESSSEVTENADVGESTMAETGMPADMVAGESYPTIDLEAPASWPDQEQGIASGSDEFSLQADTEKPAGANRHFTEVELSSTGDAWDADAWGAGFSGEDSLAGDFEDADAAESQPIEFIPESGQVEAEQPSLEMPVADLAEAADIVSATESTSSNEIGAESPIASAPASVPVAGEPDESAVSETVFDDAAAAGDSAAADDARAAASIEALSVIGTASFVDDADLIVSEAPGEDSTEEQAELSTAAWPSDAWEPMQPDEMGSADDEFSEHIVAYSPGAPENEDLAHYTPKGPTIREFFATLGSRRPPAADTEASYTARAAVPSYERYEQSYEQSSADQDAADGETTEVKGEADTMLSVGGEVATPVDEFPLATTAFSDLFPDSEVTDDDNRAAYAMSGAMSGAKTPPPQPVFIDPPAPSTPTPTDASPAVSSPASASEHESEDDIKRFREWLDGLAES